MKDSGCCYHCVADRCGTAYYNDCGETFQMDSYGWCSSYECPTEKECRIAGELALIIVITLILVTGLCCCVKCLKSRANRRSVDRNHEQNQGQVEQDVV